MARDPRPSSPARPSSPSPTKNKATMTTTTKSPLSSLLTLAVVTTMALSTVSTAWGQQQKQDDRHENCDFWAKSGECDANPNYMLQHCAYSCSTVGHSMGATDKSAEDDVTDDYDYDEDDFADDDEEEYVGPDGQVFNLESVLRRSQDAESCPAPGVPPPIVKLPENYPAKLTLAPPDATKLDVTLDDVHSQGLVPYAEYMLPTFDPATSKRRKGGGAMGAKFRNFSRRRLKRMWDDGSTDGVYNGEISAALGERDQSNTYAGHAFKFVDVKTGEMVKRFVMKEDTHIYILEPEPGDVEALNSKEYREARREKRFMKQYYDRFGYPWLSAYGRPPPVLNMWPADYLGQAHRITTSHGHWTCNEPNNPSKCHGNTDAIDLNLTVVSRAPDGPRVLVIEDLMSDAECDHILEHGKMVVKDSLVGNSRGGGGGFKSQTRTSSTGWLNRDRTPILRTLHERFADVLGLDAGKLRTSGIAEELQVVRYEQTQEYAPHHDFGDDGTHAQRFLTLLLYVEVPEDGGHTSFPKAFNGKGLRVKPPKRGGAVLFYSMLPDGNGDDLSLHAGEPVRKGEKWVCNLWVWDPQRR